MDFFVYSRDNEGTSRLRSELVEAHWSYMDGFADAMVARGPTLADDRETATGSLHILDLGSPSAAEAFVAAEPNNRAGVYASHTIWGFANALGRTMWEAAGADFGADEPSFLVIALRRETGALVEEHPPPRAEVPVELSGRLIVFGTLLTPDGTNAVGAALALHARDREHVDALIADERLGLGAFPDREVVAWERGGRR